MKQKETHDTENRLVIGKGVGAGGGGWSGKLGLADVTDYI